jgi:hypothetical protein
MHTIPTIEAGFGLFAVAEPAALSTELRGQIGMVEPKTALCDLSTLARLEIDLECGAQAGAEAELAVTHRDGFAGGAEQHRHAVGVTVAEVHVLRADVLGALVPVVVRVVGLARNEPSQELGEVLDEAVSNSLIRTQHVVWGE